MYSNLAYNLNIYSIRKMIMHLMIFKAIITMLKNTAKLIVVMELGRYILVNAFDR